MRRLLWVVTGIVTFPPPTAWYIPTIRWVWNTLLVRAFGATCSANIKLCIISTGPVRCIGVWNCVEIYASSICSNLEWSRCYAWYARDDLSPGNNVIEYVGFIVAFKPIRQVATGLSGYCDDWRVPNSDRIYQPVLMLCRLIAERAQHHSF